MEHMIVPADWKSRAQLARVISSGQENGWSVVSLGEMSGRNVLVMARDGTSYEHQVIQLFWKLRDSMASIIAEHQSEGWQVAALGDAMGGTVMILKRPVVRLAISRAPELPETAGGGPAVRDLPGAGPVSYLRNGSGRTGESPRRPRWYSPDGTGATSCRPPRSGAGPFPSPR
ncbi:hypothetical protein JW921_08190 [Candidatus Fermentibacterales bacterium]|nr:hypothetical protein [Candidatus Fermentibacterales bacterium]